MNRKDLNRMFAPWNPFEPKDYAIIRYSRLFVVFGLLIMMTVGTCRHIRPILHPWEPLRDSIQVDSIWQRSPK